MGFWCGPLAASSLRFPLIFLFSSSQTLIRLPLSLFPFLLLQNGRVLLLLFVLRWEKGDGQRPVKVIPSADRNPADSLFFFSFYFLPVSWFRAHLSWATRSYFILASRLYTLSFLFYTHWGSETGSERWHARSILLIHLSAVHLLFFHSLFALLFSSIYPPHTHTHTHTRIQRQSIPSIHLFSAHTHTRAGSSLFPFILPFPFVKWKLPSSYQSNPALASSVFFPPWPSHPLFGGYWSPESFSPIGFFFFASSGSVILFFALFLSSSTGWAIQRIPTSSSILGRVFFFDSRCLVQTRATSGLGHRNVLPYLAPPKLEINQSWYCIYITRHIDQIILRACVCVFREMERDVHMKWRRRSWMGNQEDGGCFLRVPVLFKSPGAFPHFFSSSFYSIVRTKSQLLLTPSAIGPMS